MLRARQERQAAAHSHQRTVRGRHEELASLYEMRVLYIDRGLFSDEPEPPAPPIPQIIVAVG